MNFKRDPYRNRAACGYVTAINILAVEFLVKTDNKDEYARLCQEVYKLSEDELSDLGLIFDFNRHPSTLGAMITQRDYESMKEDLMEYLEKPTSRLI